MTKIQGLTTWMAVAGATVVLSACAVPGQQPMGSYPSAPPQAQVSSGYGRVTNVQYMAGNQSNGVTGAVIGGAVGGLAGNQIGGGTGRTLATVAGVVGGALVGRHLEQSANSNNANYYRVSVQFDNGSMRNFDFADAPNVQVGDRVRADGNQLYR